MQLPFYNLLDERWIPCVMKDGTEQNQSIRQVFHHAREIREIYHHSPPVTMAVYRLLLTILHRRFGPRDMDAWVKLWQSGTFDHAALTEYLEQVHDRFHLFHETHPFYQFPHVSGLEPKGIQSMIFERSSGNNTTLFDHSVDADWLSLTPDEAALQLLAHQLYAPSSGRGKALVDGKIVDFHTKDAPLARPYCVVVIGTDLFETLMLNLVQYSDRNPFANQKVDEDKPAWEQDERRTPTATTTNEYGYLDWLTWQSRSIHLSPTDTPDGIRVQSCLYLQNLVHRNSGTEVVVFDPFVSYAKNNRDTFSSRKLDANRVVWRDSHTLLQIAADKKAGVHSRETPLVLNWLADLYAWHGAEIGLQSEYQIAVIGLVTDNSAITLWRHERLPLPMKYLQDGDLINLLKDAVVMAENVEGTLSSALWELASQSVPRPSDSPHKDTVKALFSHWGHGFLYWSALESPFRQFMHRLPNDANPDEAVARWKNTLKETARSVFEQLGRGQAQNSRSYKAYAKADIQLLFGLKQALNLE